MKHRKHSTKQCSARSLGAKTKQMSPSPSAKSHLCNHVCKSSLLIAVQTKAPSIFSMRFSEPYELELLNMFYLEGRSLNSLCRGWSVRSNMAQAFLKTSPTLKVREQRSAHPNNIHWPEPSPLLSTGSTNHDRKKVSAVSCRTERSF